MSHYSDHVDVLDQHVIDRRLEEGWDEAAAEDLEAHPPTAQEAEEAMTWLDTHYLTRGLDD